MQKFRITKLPVFPAASSDKRLLKEAAFLLFIIMGVWFNWCSNGLQNRNFLGAESLRTCLNLRFYMERCLNWYRTRLEAGHVVLIHALRVQVPPVPLLL